MNNRQRQHGLTMISLLFWGIIIIFFALLAMKLVPAYIEYFSIEKIIRDIGSDPATKSLSNGEIRDRFSKRAMVDNITTVKPEDLDITRDSGTTVISVEYPFRTRLVGNISVLIDFSASSGDGGTGSN